MSVAEMRQVQQSILDKVHTFCEENKIKYFLAAGTLLGAIRHKGYIPWDDDIDLYMLREDYNKIEALFNKLAPQNLRLLSLKTEEKYTYPFIKIEDTTTALVEDNNSFQCGINIDVFPVDGIPDDEKKLSEFYRKLSRFETIDSIKTTKISSKRSFIKNAILVIGKILTSLISIRTLSIKRDAFIRDEKFTSKKVGEISTFAYKKQFPRNLFDETKDVLFEGKYYKSPKDWDLFLKLKFGDYMKLPPLEQQITHHSFKAYWK